MTECAPESIVGELEVDDFACQLANGVSLRIGPFVARVTASSSNLMPALHSLYADYVRLENPTLHSMHLRMQEVHSWLPERVRKVRLLVDGQIPHEDMPADQSLAVLEWGLNLVIALRSHCYLMLHAAVLEIDGYAMLLPAEPGAGKSTLAAGLALSEWRLLSDEFGLLRPHTNKAIPIPRPIALKNESIEVIREFDGSAVLGPAIPKTRKGTVAHLKPPGDSVRRSDVVAPVRWIAFPKWRPEVPTTITRISKPEAFVRIASNAFNYELVGEPAFHTVSRLASEAQCFELEYSNLGNAVAALTDFVRRNEI